MASPDALEGSSSHSIMGMGTAFTAREGELGTHTINT